MAPRLLRAVLVVLIAAAGCGDGGDDEPESPDPQPQAQQADPEEKAAAPAGAGTKVVLRSSQFGRILFDSRRQAIYMFDKERSKRARCYGACADAWPPVYAEGRPRAGKGLRRSLLGTTRRRDGRRQVTYGGHPLYYYAHEQPGQVLCHDVEGFGGLWLVLRRGGNPAPS